MANKPTPGPGESQEAGSTPEVTRRLEAMAGTTRQALLRELTRRQTAIDRNANSTLRRYGEWWNLVRDALRTGAVGEGEVQRTLERWMGQGQRGEEVRQFLQQRSADLDGDRPPYEERPRTGVTERRVVDDE